MSETVLWKEWSFLLVYVGFATFSWKIWKLEKNSDYVHWNVWVNIKALHVRNNTFKNWILSIRFWIIYILVQISVLGAVLGCFNQCFFYFLLPANHSGRNFYSASPPPPTIKTLPTACNMFIVWSLVHNLFQFSAMINCWMK